MVRSFLLPRAPAYLQAVAAGREAAWRRELQHETDRITRGWHLSEIDDFNRIVEQELRGLRLELRLGGRDELADRYGVALPSRPPYRLIWAALGLFAVAIGMSIEILAG